MALRYWVGGNGTWNTTTTHWSTTSGGSAGSAAPTSADDVIVDSASGSPTITLSGTLNCKSITTTGATCTFTSTGTITIAGSVTLSSTTTCNNTGTWTLNTTSTITTNGVSLSNAITINGTGITVTLGSALSTTSARTITLTAGSLNLAGYTLTSGLFVCTGTTANRTLTFGGGQITLSGDGTTILNLSGQSGVNQLTLVGSPIFNLTNSSAFGTRTINLGGWTAFGVTDGTASFNITSGGGVVSIAAGSIYWNNFTASSSASCSITFSGATTTIRFDGNFDLSHTGGLTMGTITGLVALNGSGTAATLKLNSSYVNAFTTLSSSLNSASLTFLSNATFSTVTITSSLVLGGFTLATATLGLGSPSISLGGGTITCRSVSYVPPSAGATFNSGSGGKISVTPVATGTTAISIDDTAGAITFSGTGGFEFNGNSNYATTFALATTGPNLTCYLGNNGSGTISSIAFSSNTGVAVNNFTCISNSTTYGSMTGSIAPTGNISLAVAASPGSLQIAPVVAASTTKTITFNGATIPSLVINNASSGITQFADTASISGTLALTTGTLDGNNKTIAAGTVSTSGTATRSLLMGTGTWTVSGSGTAWSFASVTGLTVTPSTSTVSMTSASAKTFAGGGKTWGALNQGGAGALTITGSNTFSEIKNTAAPCSVLFTAGTTSTVTTFSLTGSAGNLVTVGSVTAATHTLSKSGGTVSVDYLSISQSIATGGAAWYAGANSTDGGNNTGWIFSAAPIPGANAGNFFLMFG